MDEKLTNKNTFTDSSTDVSTGEVKEFKLGEKAWYVATCYSTHEKKVADYLNKRIESMGLKDLIFKVLVAEKEVPVMNKETGQPSGKTRMKNLFPGYIFIQMIMTDYAWFVVRNTPGVTGFVGSSGKGTKPFPVPREEIEPILRRMGQEEPGAYDSYNEGDKVKVISGGLEGTEGTIISINRETKVATIEAIFFGRPTPAEVELKEIEKIK